MTDEASQRLSEYVDGTLSGRERAELDAHLAECSVCRAELEELRRVVAWLKTDPPDAVRPAEFAAIRRRIRPRAARWPIIIPWAAAAVLAILAGTLLLSRPEPAGQTPYQRAVAELEIVLRQGGPALDAEVRSRLEHSLAVIDQAIRESEDVLVADTDNEFVSRHLARLRADKIAALRQAVVVMRARL